MQIINYAECVPYLDKIVANVKPARLSTWNLNIEIRKGRAKSRYYGEFDREGTDGRPTITVLLDPRKRKYPRRRHFKSKVHVRLYWEKYNEEKNEWDGDWYSGYTFPIQKRPKPNGLMSLLMTNKNKRVYRSGGYLDNLFLSENEEMVHTLAHEFRHFQQYSHPKLRMVWGARGRYSERDADAYAIRKVREWRAIYSPKDAMVFDEINWLGIEQHDWDDEKYVN